MGEVFEGRCSGYPDHYHCVDLGSVLWWVREGWDDLVVSNYSYRSLSDSWQDNCHHSPEHALPDQAFP